MPDAAEAAAAASMSKKTHEALLAFVEQTMAEWASSSPHVRRLRAREVDLKLSSGAKAVFLTNTRPDSLPVCTDPVEFRSGGSQVVS